LYGYTGITVQNTRPERVECFDYDRPIAIVLMTILYGFASWYAADRFEREASLRPSKSGFDRYPVFGPLDFLLGDRYILVR